jgi:GNAT superfamily N-acetyltransferase
MNDISIRKATVEDVAVIHSLLMQLEETLGATSKVDRQIEDLRKYGFSEAPCFEVLIAWNGAEAVGLVLFFREFSSWKGSPGIYVQDLYVSPDMRGTGLGAKLMQAMYEHTRDWGARYCKLTVHANNEVAIPFYEHLGFQPVENEHVLILDDL